MLIPHLPFLRRKQEDYKKAIIYLEKAKSLYIEEEETVIETYHRCIRDLAICNSKLGQFKAASTYYGEAYDLKVVLSKKANRNLSQDLETKYQSEKKEQEIQLLQAKNDAVESQRIYQRNILMGGIGLTSIAGVFLFVLYRNRQKTNKKLRELDMAKSNFFANISHELRTPLTLIEMPIQEKLNQPSLSQKERKEYELILRNNKQLINLVDQLLDLSKLESGKLGLKISKTTIKSFLKAQIEPFEYQAKAKSIHFSSVFNIQKDEVWIDQEALQKILSNLLSNALKYTNEGGRIMVSAQVNSKGATVCITNTGVSLTNDQKKKIFNRFYQTDDFKPGVGIGLALTKELVELHKGTITVDNTIEEHISFKMILPCSKSSFKPMDFFERKESIDAKTGLIPPSLGTQIFDAELSKNQDPSRPLLLIVEDNEDLMEMLYETFKNEYQLLLAKNGEEGILKAIEAVPDLIISDVMMPKKNGVELVGDLKTNELTSHIPIVLLTAKAGDDNKITGINSGADDYITKPFNSNLLKAKIVTLLANRKKMRERYSQEIILKPKDIAVTPKDEVLLKRIQSVLDTFLMDSSFSSEDFARELGYSRMQLHRKLKALTDLSTSEFLRSQRLKRAFQLLKESDSTVAEACYQSGFNSLSYFSTSFKEKYGAPPSAYLKNGESR